ncbi:MAG: murein biosynthesis integral membrane protein MurJ [Clostridia bacterium]|nr:murein biosynthesis integral membrane protein MurJ [Clostridia bacterium]
MKQGKQMARTAVFMVIAVLASKLLGMLRDVLVAGAYGTTGAAVAYETASRLPILLFDLVIGGVVAASFIPVFNEILVKEGKDAAFAYANRYINLLFVLTAGISLVGVLFSSPLVSLLAPDLTAETHTLAVLLNRIMFPMMLFMALAYALVGLLQSLGEFNLPALMSLASNGIMVLYLLVFNGRFGIVGLAVAMLVGWAVQACMQMPRAYQLGYRWRPTPLTLTPAIRRSLGMALPILVSTWMQPVCNLINTRFASGIAEGRAITAIGYANRLYIIIVGVFSFVATNLLFPYLSRATASGENEEAERLTGLSLKLLGMLILPIAFGAAVLAEPIIGIIFERGAFTAADTTLTADALRCFAIGMPFMAFNEVYTKLLFSRQQPKPAMVTAAAAMTVNFVLVWLLSPRFGVGGIAAASALAMAVNALLNHLWIRHSGTRLLSGRDWADLARMLAAAAGMGVLVRLLWTALPVDRLPAVLLAVAAGIVCYAVLLLLLGESSLRTMLARIFGRKSRNP